MKLENVVQKAIQTQDRILIEGAFKQVYEKYKNLIWHISLDLTLNHEIAKDITQECFFSFYKKVISNDSNVRDIKYYLVATCKNLCYKEKKHLEQFTELTDDTIFEDYVSKSFVSNEEITSLLSVLSKTEVRILKLRLVDELKFKDIALILNQSVNAVSSKYTRVIYKLKKEMNRRKVK